MREPDEQKLATPAVVQLISAEHSGRPGGRRPGQAHWVVVLAVAAAQR